MVILESHLYHLFDSIYFVPRSLMQWDDGWDGSAGITRNGSSTAGGSGAYAEEHPAPTEPPRIPMDKYNCTTGLTLVECFLTVR